MEVIRNELGMPFDVDDTLIMHHEKEGYPTIELEYAGEPRTFWISKTHVNFLKHQKERGYHITVHSANGFAWAERVVFALGLESYVDVVRSKWNSYVDDKSVDEWLSERVYLEDK